MMMQYPENFSRRAECWGWCGRSGLVVVNIVGMVAALVAIIMESIILSRVGSLSGPTVGHVFSLILWIFFFLYFIIISVAICSDNDCFVQTAIWSSIVLIAFGLLYSIISLIVTGSDKFRERLRQDLTKLKNLNKLGPIEAAYSCCDVDDSLSHYDVCKSKHGCLDEIVAWELTHKGVIFGIVLDFLSCFLIAICVFNYTRSYLDYAKRDAEMMPMQQPQRQISNSVSQSYANSAKSQVPEMFKQM